MIAIDLRKQHELDADWKAMQQITFIGNLDWTVTTTITFILGKANKTILDFSQGIEEYFKFILL